ncbi:MAG TPA: acyltransferase [Mycobacteriales bacterium]|nr:acyltransferase [Mycobacteriales bacterium]
MKLFRRFRHPLDRLPADEVEALQRLAQWVAREHVVPRRMGDMADGWISPLSSIRFAERVRIGHRAALGPFASLWAGPDHAWAIVGDQAQIGPGALVVAGNHEVDGLGPVRELGFEERDVVIGAGAWLGANTVVIGCRVGDGAVVGAGSVVLEDVPERAVVVGAPARVVRYRDEVRR